MTLEKLLEKKAFFESARAEITDEAIERKVEEFRASLLKGRDADLDKIGHYLALLDELIADCADECAVEESAPVEECHCDESAECECANEACAEEAPCAECEIHEEPIAEEQVEKKAENQPAEEHRAFFNFQR